MSAPPPWLLAAVLAPIVGSFLSVLATRLPEGRGIVLGRSACPRCGHVLGAAELVPLLSYLWQRGACRHCGGRIDALYPLMEAGALGVALWAAALSEGAGDLWASCALGWLLLALAAADLRTFLLPDPLVLALALAGFGASALLMPASLIDHVLGAGAGFLAFWATAALYRRWRGREGLGLGDAKLLGALGAWVSWEGLPGTVLIAAAVALFAALLQGLWRRRLSADDRLPFGPFLALGGWITWLYGPLAFG
jgi:leader peptidase (prepilin peptidase) / N-methyltransferase